RRRPGDGPGDDLALDDQALHPGFDQSGAELGEIEDAGNEGEQAGDVEKHDPAGEARKALGDEEIPAVPRQAGNALGAQDVPGPAKEAPGAAAGTGECIDAATQAINRLRCGAGEEAADAAAHRRAAGSSAAGSGMVFDVVRGPIK